MMADAGSFAALQRLYSTAGVPAHPSAGPYWPYPGAAAVAHHAQNDLLYRQAASAAVTLQKPMAYRLYPPVMLAGPSVPLGGLGAGPGLNAIGYYSRESPGAEGLEPGGREQAPLLGRRSRSRSLERSPAPAATRDSNDSPASLCKPDSDDESIHDV